MCAKDKVTYISDKKVLNFLSGGKKGEGSALFGAEQIAKKEIAISNTDKKNYV